jgi:hypothetical protein
MGSNKIPVYRSKFSTRNITGLPLTVLSLAILFNAFDTAPWLA